jgi:hypothetical protein
MANPTEGRSSTAAEALHLAALFGAALGLLLGLGERNPFWLNLGVSLILLLPPLRLATTIFSEAHAGRYRIAAIGTVVLAFLLLSRRIS